ncbi:hypothetical protein YC2023_047151 [Brassica napus]
MKSNILNACFGVGCCPTLDRSSSRIDKPFCLSKLTKTFAVPDTTAYCLKASRRLFHMGSPSNKNDPQEVLHATDQQPQKYLKLRARDREREFRMQIVLPSGFMQASLKREKILIPLLLSLLNYSTADV